MRKLFTVLCACLLVISIAVAPASAAKKKKVAPKPVLTKLYLDGEQQLGESEHDPLVNPGYLPLGTTEPDGGEPKSTGYANLVVTPNPACAGNNLFPVFVGPLVGRVTGTIKVTLHTVSTPGTVDIRLWPDVNSLLCDSTAGGTMDYPDPAASIEVDVPPGHGVIEVEIPGVDFEAQALLMLQVTPIAAPGPIIGRVLYDTPEMASGIEFMCVPPAGKVSCTS
ncbi:MAG TPA: hypothetical protein VNC78_06905 [Actinomycetota bacterium]|nr:hypothetical protein [Actinomycetota bacterium]